MRFPYPIVSAAVTALLIGVTSAELKSADKDALAESLEATYKTWAKAVREKDVETWYGVTASYAKMNIRNTVVSQRLKFPDAFFETPIKPPLLDGLTFLGAQAVSKTAQAVYFGKVDFELVDQEEADVPDSLLVLRFIKEGAEWKFDTTRMLGLAGMEDLEKQIRAGDYSFLEDEAFSPPGVVPPVAKPCKMPDKIAHLQILSIGYQTEVTINGTSRHFVSNNTSSELIMGGLSGGSNDLRFRTRPAPRMAGEDAPEPEFGIRVLTVDDHAMKDPVEVFKFRPKDGEAPPASYKAFVRGIQ